MSDIKSIQNYLLSYQKLDKNRPVWVEMLGPEARHYAVFLSPGKRVTEDIIGNRTVEYPFGFGATEVLTDNSALETAEFYEEFATWLEEQTELGHLPELDAGKVALSIEALDTATIIYRAAKTGIYQILCKLTYFEER